MLSKQSKRNPESRSQFGTSGSKQKAILNSFITGVIGTIAGICAYGFNAMPVGIQTEWQVLRAEANEVESAIDLTTEGDFNSMPSGAVEITSLDDYTSEKDIIAVIACAGSAENKTFTVKYWAWAKTNGPAQPQCSVDYTTGSQAVVYYPHNKAAATDRFWADTATVTSYLAQGVGRNGENEGDGVIEVAFDIRQIGWLYPEVTGADNSTGNEAGNVTIYYRFYSR